MADYNVGDRVQVNDPDDTDIDLGTVVAISDGPAYRIRLDNDMDADDADGPEQEWHVASELSAVVVPARSAELRSRRAQMSQSEINNLPDSAFAYIEPGGTKDASGKTSPRSLRHFPIHDAAHVRNAMARAAQSPFGKQAMPKIMAAAKKFGIDASQANSAGPLDLDVVRAIPSAVEYRDDAGGDGLGLMNGHFSVFGDWYRVDSKWEGTFIERMSPGAFDQTINEDRAGMKVLFDHGFDPQIGNKVLGPIRELRSDGRGAYYEVPLFDTSYNRDLLPGLKAGVYGASMRFHVEDESWDKRAGQSSHNPDALPERTITRASVREFGPVTFPASPGASAGVRSMTDQFYDLLRQRDGATFEAALRAAGLPDLTGASSARSRDRGDRPDRAQLTTRQRVDSDALRLRGVKLS